MKRGLIIGKFMPVHTGHLALIDFASSRCDELIVSMSFTDSDPIPSDLRFAWLQQLVGDRSNIRVAIIKDDFDDETLPLQERTSVWADVMRRTYPHIDVIFSSEEYGLPFAVNLHADHVSFDRERRYYPVSASAIRHKPFANWAFIPSVVRPYFVKKICFFGPESTGKTTMTRRMAELFDTDWVPEVARELIIKNDFDVDQIITIGRMQTARVMEKLKTANKLLMCDTDLITTQIYSQHYLNTIPAILVEYEKQVSYDHYFLLDIDVAWVADGLRDLPHMRNEMMTIFKDALEKRGIAYTLVSGTFQECEQKVIETIRQILAKYQ